MDMRIKTDGFDLTPVLNEYVEERMMAIRRLLGAGNAPVRCEVELGRDAGRPRHGKNIWYAEIQIIRPGERIVRASNRSESINGAVDDAKEEVERQLRSGKGVHTRMMRRGGAIVKRLLRRE
jgi:ribosomal subunit interface protein